MRLQELGLDFKYDGKPWSGFKVCLCIRVCVCVCMRHFMWKPLRGFLTRIGSYDLMIPRLAFEETSKCHSNTCLSIDMRRDD